MEGGGWRVEGGGFGWRVRQDRRRPAGPAERPRPTPTPTRRRGRGRAGACDAGESGETHASGWRLAAYESEGKGRGRDRHQIDRDGLPPKGTVKLSQFAVSNRGSLIWNGRSYDELGVDQVDGVEQVEAARDEVIALVDQHVLEAHPHGVCRHTVADCTSQRAAEEVRVKERPSLRAVSSN